MRRAISPAICTQVTSWPERVRSHMALRSFSTEALSRAALRNRPAWYQSCCTVPSTGERLEWTLNTFMNTSAAHSLETWSDARAYDGTVTILQPLIAPLYEGA